MRMEEVAFSEWPGQPVDLDGGGNPWLPAYGCQTPAALLDREDFLGNPDAEYFLSANGGAGLMGGHYMYLETILEETSDDLRSEDSDIDSRCSPAGWFATDSEAGSVICIDAPEDLGCESDRELACPAKRRKQDYFLSIPSTEEDLSSLSRSSSLVQFETLEKQCQEICSSSPSVYSQFSFDSLEAANRTKTVSPDSLNSPDDVDYYKTLKIDKKSTKDDSLLYNATRLSGSDSSDSDGTLGNSRSCDNLKTWRSFDSLPVNTKSVKEKISAENLSEDSGYSDHMTKSSSASNLKDREGRRGSRGAKDERRGYVGFAAYDGDVFTHEHISGNFGISYHDLTIFSTPDTANRLDSLKSPSSSVAMDRYFAKSPSATFGSSAAVTKTLKLDRSECADSNFRQPSCSEPDLLQACAASTDDSCKVAIDTVTGSASSVPKDLNYLSGDDAQVSPLRQSVAAKDWDLADFLSIRTAEDLNYLSGEDPQESVRGLAEDLNYPAGEEPAKDKEVPSEDLDLEDAEMAMTENAGQYRREGSYAEAMANRVDLSDDEHSLINRNKPKLPKHAIVEFDKRVLKAISEQSLQSVLSSTQNLTINERRAEEAFASTPISEKRNIASTPNLAAINQSDPDRSCFDEERRRSAYDIRRKNSGIKSSTSTSGLSDGEEKTLSYAGSTNSKGVHFSPVVSEVNWRDSSISTVTPDRESSVYSLESSSPERRASPPKEIHKPRARRLAYSQPNLSDNDEVCKREFEDSLKSLRQADYSKSQPDVSRLRRRGSQLVKKDKDGAVVRAYVDSDGVQYRHTHLDQGLLGAAAAQQRFLDKRGGQSQLAAGGGESVDAMQRCEEIADGGGGGRRKRSGKIGGFFQRLTGLRFSLRKTEAKKKERYAVPRGGDGNANGAALLAAPHQRVATKSDYIYIPLKGPPGGGGADRSATANGGGAQAVAAKPPLPKQPPRVVHVSVKQGSRGQLHDHSPPLSSSTLPSEQQQSTRSHHHRHHHQQQPQQQHRRHRTIDATPGGGHGGGGGGGSSLANASPIGAMNSSHIAATGADSLDGHTCVGGLLETDIDTQVTVVTSANGTKARSLLDLGDGSSGRNRQQLTLQAGEERRDRPHKSMEFLLDKENLKVVEPPENELQKGERVMSEHQLRVQRSLQKLTVPEWYRQSQVPREGFLLKKNSPRETRWTGTTSAGSKTTSLSSLGSNTQSPVVLSPTPCNQPFVRWSTSKLNSTASSPCASTRSSFNTRQPNGSISPSSVRSSFSYRQPYLGWRSQERLNRPRTPAERLASSLLNSQNAASQQVPPQPSPEIQTSIKEVTSAIVHYVSGLHPPASHQEAEGGSPRGSASRLCWLESSFVGSRPPDSPETPVVAISETTTTPGGPPNATGGLRLELQAHNEVTLVMSSTTAAPPSRPSPGSATLEDVLDSLLGLPSSGRAPSPSLQGTESPNTSPCPPLTSSAHPDVRRRSDGSDACSEGSRRQSMTSSPVLRCRYSRCGRATLATAQEAAAFKNCHNCSYTYCSRACRRAHWEKHRKTCLFSRIGSLCRQVIASAKEQKDTLMHLSKIARRGYLSQGVGAVKCFFPNPEAAESFLTHGLSNLGEITYVRWQDLLPSEMGPQLYSELVKMCKCYNPESKLILYVCVCVISETPAAGAVKWERQLVSRCAKMRLSKEEQSYESLETLILTSSPLMGDTFTVRELRTRCVDNLQGHLRIKGVSLKKQHPEIHRQLTAYVEDATVQLPTMTVFPKDSFTGKSFMCVIMLEVNQKSVKEVEGTRGSVRTIDVMRDVFGSV